jgi:hypothetical protein
MSTTCNGCRFACFVDYGYSNYTVEGTEFYCAKSLHPDGHFDRFYGEDKRLDFAAECSGFEAGEPISMDVDQEGIADLTPDQRTVWEMHQPQS